ncbi:hypothetical protein [Rhizobium leucaenae]|jgi:hypothetical protein|uniref:hypothetical protein n=1 Tax=Rhizobium leucaenae TaxID=29450 RepID=UPI0012B624BD|nr:hypothetical protein [Rhizobium leucaenae]
MKTGMILIAALIAGTAHAQQIVDASGKAIDEKVTKAMFSALTSEAKDPLSAQFIDLRFAKSRPELVCGEVNLKNSFGAYTGFKPFGFNTEYNNLLMDQNLSDCAQ